MKLHNVLHGTLPCTRPPLHIGVSVQLVGGRSVKNLENISLDATLCHQRRCSPWFTAAVSKAAQLFFRKTNVLANRLGDHLGIVRVELQHISQFFYLKLCLSVLTCTILSAYMYLNRELWQNTAQVYTDVLLMVKKLNVE